MKTNFVDTNIFIEMFVRKGSKSDKSYQFLVNESSLRTNYLVISEMEWVMRAGYKIAREDIVRSIRKILTSDVEVDSKKILINTLNFYELNNVDWTDCLNMFLLKVENISTVYSYDKGLSKFDWIKRLEP